MNWTLESVISQFPDWYRMKGGDWSEHPIIIRYGKSGNNYIEIGLYREPEDDLDEDIKGTYTLQGFDGDEVIFCHTVEGLDVLRYKMEKENLI